MYIYRVIFFYGWIIFFLMRDFLKNLWNYGTEPYPIRLSAI
nr:MAG TPA: hypothetical protein [Caudoviricetes sp.]